MGIFLSSFVTLLVAMVIAPLVSHRIWKKQKLRDQQLAIAQRFASLLSTMMSYEALISTVEYDHKWGSTLSEFLGILKTIQVLFKREGIGTLAARLPPEKDRMLDGAKGAELQARLFAEALNVPEKVVAQVKF